MKVAACRRAVAAGTIGAAIAGILLGASSPARAGSSGDSSAELREKAKEIQNVCFAAYPEDLLMKMSGRSDPPPDAREDPRAQRKFLRTEALVAKGLFYPSLLEELLPSFEAEVRRGARFLDLGSGDGRVVFLAALLGARATGVEFDSTLYRVARRARRRLTPLLPPESVALKRGDFFREDLSAYDVLFYYGRGSYGETRLLAKIARELAPGATLLLAHADRPPEGLVTVAAYGPVRVIRRPVP